MDADIELALRRVEVSERETFLAQRGLEELPCCCIVSRRRPGAPTQMHDPCPVIAEAYDRYRAQARKLTIGSAPQAVTEAQKTWGAVKKHVTEGRRWKKTGKPPKSATIKGYGT